METGSRHSEESKRKMSDSHKGHGHKMSDEQRKRMSEIAKAQGRKPPGRKGAIVSEETRRKLSESHKKPLTEERLREMAEKESRRNKPKVMSSEARKKISEALKGHAVSEETRKKMSVAKKAEFANGKPGPMAGKKHTTESLAKMSESQKSRAPMSDETKRKISEANKSRIYTKWSDESRQRLSDSLKASGRKPPSRLGIPNSEEQREKIRQTHRVRGIKPPPMYGDANPSKRPEVREKISKAHTGKSLSEEHKRSLSEHHFKTHSPETRAKMSAASRANVAARLFPWKNGNTPEAMRIRHSNEIKAWRKAVFERDDYTCQICHQRGGRLVGHHIKPFAKFPEYRFDVDNGMTVCKPCHIYIHSEAIGQE